MRKLLITQQRILRTFPLIIAGLLFCVACQSTSTSVSTKSNTTSHIGGDDTKLNTPILQDQEGRRWLEIDPEQCAGWWLDNERNLSIPAINKYYSERGFEIYNAKTISFEQKFGYLPAICEACSCPEGFTLYVLVDEADVEALLEIGHRNIVEDCNLVPSDIYVYGCPR